MKRLLGLLAAIGLLGALAAPLPAQPQTPTPAETIIRTTTPAPAPGSTTIQTTAPVSAETTISLGTLAGEALTWLAVAFSVPVGMILTGWLFRLFKLVGVETTNQMRTRLQEIVVNGLNAGATQNAERFQGMGKIQIKNVVVADAIKYAQAHGAETIKALGLDPNSGAAVEAIKARIETAITDPMTPTPAVLAGPVPDAPKLPITRDTPSRGA